MKAHLLFTDADFALVDHPDENQHDRFSDLELGALVRAMAADDAFLAETATAALHQPLTDPVQIRHRQQALTDALANPEAIRALYALPVQALAEAKRIYSWGLSSPSGMVHHGSQLMEVYIRYLRSLRLLADENAPTFQSPAFATLFQMLRAELTDEYFDEIDEHLAQLRFRHGVLSSAHLGEANKATRITLRRPAGRRIPLLQRLGFTHPAHTMTIPDRDEAGFSALHELQDRGVDLVANALIQSTDHIKSFLTMLQRELAFYLGAINLHNALTAQGEPTTIPTLTDSVGFAADELYDIALVLISGRPAVGNAVDATATPLVVITGANRGGKSTFLRSLGQAQLLTQCGLFAPAAAFSTGVRTGIFTHFKREEDKQLVSGKLDEELGRMSRIVDAVTQGAMVLFNESFASTNEREGSEISRHIVHAFRDRGVTVAFVTHLFDFAHRLREENRDDILFLRAHRGEDGGRDFTLAEGEPLSTSFGWDVYRRVFGEVGDPRPADRMSLTAFEEP